MLRAILLTLLFGALLSWNVAVLAFSDLPATVGYPVEPPPEAEELVAYSVDQVTGAIHLSPVAIEGLRQGGE